MAATFIFNKLQILQIFQFFLFEILMRNFKHERND